MPGPPVADTNLVWRLSIRNETRDGACIVTPAGRLGTLSSGELIAALASATDEGHRRLVLDCRDVDYISSAGLLALEVFLRRLADAGGELVVCGLREPVRLAFDLSGMLSHFVVCATTDEALGRFERRSTTLTE